MFLYNIIQYYIIIIIIKTIISNSENEDFGP